MLAEPLMDTTPGADEDSSARTGIFLIVLALSLAAFSGSLMKLLTDSMSPPLVAWFRFSGYFLIMLPVALLRVGRQTFKPPRIAIQILRGLLLAVGNILFMFGVVALDFADAIAILYIYPFLMTVMAPFVLGERVAPIAWIGVVGGFIGVLLVVRPEFDRIDIHAVFVLGTGFMVALQMLMNRKLGVMADPAVISLWGALIPTIVLLPAIPFLWKPIGIGQVGILSLMAVTTAVSQTMMILAMARAKASVLAPFTYTEIISAVLIGLVIFGTLPDTLSWFGVGLIILCGVMVARTKGRQTFRRQPKI